MRFILLYGFAGLVLSVLPPSAGAADQPLKLSLVGQALIAHDLRADPYPGLDALTRHLAAADVGFTNLETAIRTPASGKPTKKGLYLHTAEPVVLDCLKSMNLKLLALSNNHAGDLGPEGVLAALHETQTRGLTTAGAGRNLPEATAPVFLKTPRGTVALVAMAPSVPTDSIASAQQPGVNHLAVDDNKQLNETDAARNLKAIRAAAARADVVIVYQHNHYWEKDNRVTPDWQKTWARQCIDAGATIYVAHGVPRLHGIEVYKNRPIFYSLGNFVFHTRTPPGHYPEAVWRSVVVDCLLRDKEVTSLTLRPLRLTRGKEGDDFLKTRGRPYFAEGDEARDVFDELLAASKPLGTTIKVEGGVGVITLR